MNVKKLKNFYCIKQAFSFFVNILAMNLIKMDRIGNELQAKTENNKWGLNILNLFFCTLFNFYDYEKHCFEVSYINKLCDCIYYICHWHLSKPKIHIILLA